MKSIRVENFAGLAECSTDTFSSVESFPPVNYEFLSGKTMVSSVISDAEVGDLQMQLRETADGRRKARSILTNDYQRKKN